MSIKENIIELKESIIESALKTDRKPENIRLIAVSKTFQEDDIKEAYNCGLKLFGENRIQEASSKINNLKHLDIEWHLVGHLQSNKAKKAVELFNVIQSIDKISTLKKVNDAAKNINKIQKVLIEVNTSEEESKFGISPEDVNEFIKKALEYKSIEISGLMTIGPFTDDVEKIKASFNMLKNIFYKVKEEFFSINFNILSMGMTDDFKIAIECGSNMIRIGRKIFGQRGTL